MNFYDAHIHFTFTRRTEHLQDMFFRLKKIGIKGFDAFFMAEFPFKMRTILAMVPEDYHGNITYDSLLHQRNPFSLMATDTDLEIVPYLDARFIETDIERKIEKYQSIGFKGLKLLYVPEEDTGTKIGGMQKAFGRSLKQSERITSLLIDNASAREMCITIHADLRRYGRFIETMIKEHPNTNFNIPHFGYSRRAISPILEKYPNCFTDLSSLDSFVKNRGSYLDFIRHYRDKVLFGSDASINAHDKENILSPPSMKMESCLPYLP
ncbi:conserved hypothetical protein [delta proteobacterium NaphS2]|nr:conserved hypothetical protein [delta proteobacterium NaphS2]